MRKHVLGTLQAILGILAGFFLANTLFAATPVDTTKPQADFLLRLRTVEGDASYGSIVSVYHYKSQTCLVRGYSSTSWTVVPKEVCQ